MEGVLAPVPSFEDGSKPLMTDISPNVQWLGEVGGGERRYRDYRTPGGFVNSLNNKCTSSLLIQAEVPWSHTLGGLRGVKKMSEYNAAWEIVCKLPAEGGAKPMNNLHLSTVHLLVPVTLSLLLEIQEDKTLQGLSFTLWEQASYVLKQNNQSWGRHMKADQTAKVSAELRESSSSFMCFRGLMVAFTPVI